MEQLQEEKKDEVAAIRAEIYANVKVQGGFIVMTGSIRSQLL